jgi:hypothetical protein
MRMMEVPLALSCVPSVSFDMAVRGFAVFSALPSGAFLGFDFAFGPAEALGRFFGDVGAACAPAFAFGAALAAVDAGDSVVLADFASTTGCAVESGLRWASAAEVSSPRSALDASSTADGFVVVASFRAAPAGFWDPESSVRGCVGTCLVDSSLGVLISSIFCIWYSPMCLSGSASA